jgi:tetrahydromethanopterin S-methyltransferase subunit H
MSVYQKEQKIFDIGNVKVGGQPGELPTLLMGSIFYAGHKIVTDEKKGLFDQKAAEDIINKIATLSDKTSNPHILDIVGSTEEAFRRYIDFVAKVTDAPLQLDSIGAMARIGAAKYVAEVGLQDRVIYNSVFKNTPQKEVDTIRESKIKASIILDDNPQNNSTDGKLEALEAALLKAEQAGITKPLIDTAIEAYGAEMGPAIRVIPLIREKYGYPVGTGTGNISGSIGWTKANFPREVRRACDAALNSAMVAWGVGWLMYGAVELAYYVFPAVAIADTMALTMTAELGIKPVVEGVHPAFRTIG